MTDRQQTDDDGRARRPRRSGARAVSPTARRRLRMAPDDREGMILDGALRFFAEHGFAGQTRELARSLGVSQALIFRYFATKEALIERVYQRNFLARWHEQWEAGLRDRARPLDARLKAFYRAYIDVIDSYEWIRIAMFSGLEGNNLTRRYIETQIERVLDVIALELRAAGGCAGDGPVSAAESERAWHLHSTVIYYLVRKHIFKTRTMADHGELVDLTVAAFLDGALARSAP